MHCWFVNKATGICAIFILKKKFSIAEPGFSLHRAMAKKGGKKSKKWEPHWTMSKLSFSFADLMILYTDSQLEFFLYLMNFVSIEIILF